MSLADQVVAAYIARNWKIATAESCTGGLVAAAITSVAGSSAVFERGFVTYSNAAKTEMLGVDDNAISQHGAVSQTVAQDMAAGALSRSSAHVAVAVTGIAGPSGGSAEKPVGLVHFACAERGSATRHIEIRYRQLGRDHIRKMAVEKALQMLLDAAR